ncbi:LOW QUALITY PROTEIN: vesicle transport protein SFT2C [Phascolarctos cinereus]|uniref:Vesicle transport protein n=1 Tax=Phascolarctos cinereus TaxID=38626 RepID=A0A6P5INX0_PHACI|nr:LOW QUALITY PROTEIN: vesicle transport protein SFT2C [Phascolarctos cinereus]
MADLNRQLQEYLAQSKGASSADTVPLLPAEEKEAAGAGRTSSVGVWLGRANPFPGRGGPGWAWLRGPALPPDDPEPGPGPPCLPSLSRWQRLSATGVCLVLAALCFGLAALYAPMLLLRARKFALLWSLGSVFALAASALLRGGPACLRLLRCEERPSRTGLLYLAALGGTLYAALGLRSTALTALGAASQVAALLAALFGLLPWGGGPALRYALGGLCGGLARTLPV